MPDIKQNLYAPITPEDFLEGCTSEELKEVRILIHSPKFQERMFSIVRTKLEAVK